jgi:tetratricopeptide (TPR) repeat protein
MYRSCLLVRNHVKFNSMPVQKKPDRLTPGFPQLAAAFLATAFVTSVLAISVHAESRAPTEHMSMEQLEHIGTEYRLAGDFERGEKIQEALLLRFEEPVGHTFALNTITTHLTWDETSTQYDASLKTHAGKILDWCDKKIEADPALANPYFYCGQAHFSLSYYHGLRGNYYQAGRHGTLSIDYLENALALDATLVDAKMHLGVAYYIADNLPPFIKMFSKLLWFIPTGNSEKSLPYLREVMNSSKLYANVCRYVYSTLLLEGDDGEQEEARIQLSRLVHSYPKNPRFQLRLISALLVHGDYQATLDTARAYVNNDNIPSEPDLSLAKIWMVRAYMGLARIEQANSLFQETDAAFMNRQADLPLWSIAWHMLTDGQLHDLAHRRTEALNTYSAILKLSRSRFINKTVTEAARDGLRTPYAIPH